MCAKVLLVKYHSLVNLKRTIPHDHGSSNVLQVHDNHDGHLSIITPEFTPVTTCYNPCTSGVGSNPDDDPILYGYRRCHNYRTELGVQKFGKNTVFSYSSGSRFRADSDPVL